MWIVILSSSVTTLKTLFFKLFNHPPKAEAIELLRFSPDWILQNPDTPFFPEVWPFAQDFIFKVGGEPVIRHRQISISSRVIDSQVSPFFRKIQKGDAGVKRSVTSVEGER